MVMIEKLIIIQCREDVLGLTKHEALQRARWERTDLVQELLIRIRRWLWSVLGRLDVPPVSTNTVINITTSFLKPIFYSFHDGKRVRPVGAPATVFVFLFVFSAVLYNTSPSFASFVDQVLGLKPQSQGTSLSAPDKPEPQIPILEIPSLDPFIEKIMRGFD